MRYICSVCGSIRPIDTLDYQCPCGGLWDLELEPGEKVPDDISLGEVVTPVLPIELSGKRIWLKLDWYQPTGSFKDRGARTLISAFAASGIQEVVEDSSGNAGAAIAAYCARAGIRCHIYLPEGTSPGKLKQIAAYGARIVRIPGSRDETAQAIREAARHTHYASHVYNPLFFAGTSTLAGEIAAQTGIPDTLILPAGNGTLVLGTYHGFKALGRLPRLVAVQAEYCAPCWPLKT